MKRILLVMSVAALTAAMLAVTAVPAFATIHELSRVPEDNPDQASPIAGEFPPGLSDADVPDLLTGPEGEHENESQNSDTLNSEGPRGGCPDRNSCDGNFAQAIVSVGQNPSDNSTNAFESSSPSNK